MAEIARWETQAMAEFPAFVRASDASDSDFSLFGEVCSQNELNPKVDSAGEVKINCEKSGL
jgi:hypothetical protein